MNWLLRFLAKLFDFEEDVRPMEGQTKTREIKRIILHCAFTTKGQDTDVDDIRAWHINERGWSDIGYHWFIKFSGKIQEGRDLDEDGDIFEEIGAHTFGYNRDSLGICLEGGKAVGGGIEHNFTEQQFKSLARLIRIIKADFPNATIHGHNEFSNKACPVFDVRKFLDANKL